MNLFYVPEIEGELVNLPEEEARHVVQVMRKKVGEEIMLVDGKGHWHRLEITETAKKRCRGRILETLMPEEKRNFHLHIAIAPTKNINRLEWFLEKATEFGIDEITPMLCGRSERKKLRPDRLEKILVAAMKQSLKAYLPQLNPLTTFEDLLRQPFDGQRFIAYLDEDVKGHLKENYRKAQNVLILIGPEGDFSPEEVALAKAKGFEGVSLGKSRLRTETAGIAACHIVNLVNGS
jgi:16S rRNA (uracil1498-N3)-methyltransferase